MSSTKETIFWILLPRAVGQIFGKLAGAVTTAYKTHIRLVAEAIRESRSGDLKIRKLEEIEKNLEAMVAHGRDLLSHLPKVKEVENGVQNLVVDANALRNPRQYDEKVKQFVQEYNALLEILKAFITAAEQLIVNVRRDVEEIERGLFQYKNSTFRAFRFIVDKKIEEKIALLKLEGWGPLPALQEMKRNAQNRLAAYQKVFH